jgi:hypothetical protein
VNPSQRVSQYAHTGLSLGNVLSLSMIKYASRRRPHDLLAQAFPRLLRAETCLTLTVS